MLDDWPIALAGRMMGLAPRLHCLTINDRDDLVPFCNSGWSVSIDPALSDLGDYTLGPLVSDIVERRGIPLGLGCLKLGYDQMTEEIESIISGSRPVYLKIIANDMDADRDTVAEALKRSLAVLKQRDYRCISVYWQEVGDVGLDQVTDIVLPTSNTKTLRRRQNIIASRNDQGLQRVYGTAMFLKQYCQDLGALTDRLSAMEQFADEQSKALISLQNQLSETQCPAAEAGPRSSAGRVTHV